MKRISKSPEMMPPPKRISCPAPQPWLSTMDWVLAIVAVWALISRCCPLPDRCRSVSAIITLAAASAPACWNACGTLQRRGGRSASPVSHMALEEAVTVRSVAAQAAFGPTSPKGVIEAWMIPGCSAARAA